jgi:hypothetical protein
MSLTLEQRTNHEGIPKAAELIEITGAHGLEASDRAILNLLYQYAHDSGRLGDPAACWELAITALRPSKHNGTDRSRDSLSRLISVQVKVAYRDAKTGKDRILLTHLFESFDIPADEGSGGPVRYRVPIALVPVLAAFSRWGNREGDLRQGCDRIPVHRGSILQIPGPLAAPHGPDRTAVAAATARMQRSPLRVPRWSRCRAAGTGWPTCWPAVHSAASNGRCRRHQAA